jgi:ADP-ribose pyrophosphatase YjhB (NUDIX family)
MIEVCLGIVIKNREILLVERIKKEIIEEQELIWAFPGGKKKETDPNIEFATQREVREETGVISVPRQSIVRRSIGSTILHYTICDYARGELKPKTDEIRSCDFYSLQDTAHKFEDNMYSRVYNVLSTLLSD